jgi:succinate dehydrogenase / fumarate reductase cytochrome b subunit
MPNKRPVYLNLMQIRLPIAGVMSIIHRVTGVVMFFAIPLLAWLLSRSLSGPEGFAGTARLFDGLFGALLLLAMLWALLHHLLAGIRYLLLDVEIGVEKPVYRYSAWAVTLTAPLLALLLTGVMR